MLKPTISLLYEYKGKTHTEVIPTTVKPALGQIIEVTELNRKYKVLAKLKEKQYLACIVN